MTRNTGSAGGGKIGINEKMPPAFPNTGPEQSKVAHKFHTAGDTTANKNTNFEMAGPAKNRNTQSPGGKKNNSVTPSKGDDGTKATRIKMSASNLTGKKIIFEQEKTAVVSPSADTRATLSIKTSGPTHSVDHKLSMGTYLPGPLGPGNKTAVAGDRLRNSGIDARALINQIASQARKPGRVRIALTPPRLGKLDMDVIVRDNKVQVILKTDNNDVCQALKSNTAGLENTLRNQGLMVNTIHVSVQEKPGDHNFGFSQNGNTFKEGSHRENNSRPHRGETDPIEYDLARSPKEKPGVRMDGQVSLFI